MHRTSVPVAGLLIAVLSPVHAAGPPECLSAFFDGSSAVHAARFDLASVPAAAPAAPPAPSGSKESDFSTTAEVPDSEWVLEESPGEPIPERGPSAPERMRFWDRLQDRAFDDICRGIQLRVNKDVSLEPLGVGVRVERTLRRYPNKTVALVDAARLAVSLGHSQKLLSLAEGLPLPLTLEGRAEGTAYVIRPLGSTKSCSEIGKLINILDFKTVIPVSPERIGAMRVGELWKLPLVLRATARLSAQAPAGPATLTVSLGLSQEETASVSLLRLREDAVRLRLRLDRARILDAGGAVQLTIPLGDPLGLQTAGNFLERELDRQIARQINRFLVASLGLSQWKRDGRKVLLEFVLDPRDPQQVQALADFIEGDLEVLSLLLRIAHAATNPFIRDGSASEYLDRLREGYVRKLGADSTFAGADDYQRKGKDFNLWLPFLYSHESSSNRESDRIVGDENDVALHMHQASSRKTHAWIDVPFLGQVVKSRSEHTVYSFTQVDSKGFGDGAMLAYIQQEGFLRHSEATVREMVGRVNEILRYAGTRGEGENPRFQLPLEAMIPPRPAPPPKPLPRDPAAGPPPSPLYRSALTAFTLVFKRSSGLPRRPWSRPTPTP